MVALHQQLIGERVVVDVLSVQVDRVVCRSLVYLRDVLLLVLHDSFPHPRVISLFRVVLYLAVDLRVLWEDLSHKEGL